MAIRFKFKQLKATLTLIGLTFLLVFPQVSSDYALHIAIISLFYIMLSSSWNLVAGFTGQVSFAHSAFAALGAYGSGFLANTFHLPMALTVLAGASISTVFGFCLGTVCLRQGGTYLSLVTLSFAEIVRIVLTNEDQWTRGTMGLQVPGLFATYVKAHYYYLFLAVTALIVLGIKILIQSELGMKFRAVMEDEIAAASLGVSTTRVRLLAFVLSSFIAGLAGALYGHYVMLISPDLGSLAQMFLVLCITLIGGIGTLSGPVIGALLIEILSEEIRAFGEYHILVFGIITLMVLLYAPKGIVGSKRAPR